MDNNNNGQKVLITGGFGFIGSHLVKNFLENTDWDIIILDDKHNYSAMPERVTELDCYDESRITVVQHDLRRPITGIEHEEVGRVDYVIHCAAESHVDNSTDDPEIFVKSNVLGTSHLLSYIKGNHSPKKIVIFGTDEVYGDAPKGVYYPENAQLNPSNPYSASKCGEDMMALAFKRCFNMPIIITRCMNVFAERQHPEKFIPKVIGLLQEGKPVTIHGTKDRIPTRKWVHVDDVYNALTQLLGETKHDIYHIIGEEHSVLDMAQYIADIMGKELKVEYIDERPGQDYGYGLQDNNLKLEHKVEFYKALEDMVKWTLNNPHWICSTK